MNIYILNSGVFYVKPTIVETQEPLTLSYLVCKVKDEHNCERGMILKFLGNYLVYMDVNLIDKLKVDYEYIDFPSLTKIEIKRLMNIIKETFSSVRLVFE